MRKLTSILIILLMSFILIGCEEKPDVLPRLSTPYNLSFKDDVLTFNTVLHADGYILNLNGENITLETNEFAFTSSGEYTIQVKAFGEGYRDSLFSTPYHLTITRLKGETRTQYNYSIHSEFDLLVAEYDEMIFGTSLQKIDPINHDEATHLPQTAYRVDFEKLYLNAEYLKSFIPRKEAYKFYIETNFEAFYIDVIFIDTTSPYVYTTSKVTTNFTDDVVFKFDTFGATFVSLSAPAEAPITAEEFSYVDGILTISNEYVVKTFEANENRTTIIFSYMFNNEGVLKVAFILIVK